jgi:hypothetical protein
MSRGQGLVDGPGDEASRPWMLHTQHLAKDRQGSYKGSNLKIPSLGGS